MHLYQVCLHMSTVGLQVSVPCVWPRETSRQTRVHIRVLPMRGRLDKKGSSVDCQANAQTGLDIWYSSHFVQQSYYALSSQRHRDFNKHYHKVSYTSNLSIARPISITGYCRDALREYFGFRIGSWYVPHAKFNGKVIVAGVACLWWRSRNRYLRSS